MRQFAFLFAALIASPTCAQDPARYIGVIDAGSSGSRLYVYQRAAQDDRIDDVFEVNGTAAPLASHAIHPDIAGDKAIGPLLGALDRVLAEHGVGKPELEIHVLATGGMRLVPAPVAQTIESSVRRTIVENGFRPGRIETISGEAEGFYAWLDVNMLLGRLGPGSKPAGIVEIGGASMQVAYAGAPSSDPGVITASFGGRAYSVRSLTFLGLGAEQARKSLMTSDDAGACFPLGLVGDTPDLKDLRGAFDATRCAAAFAAIVTTPAKALPRDEVKDLDFIGLGRPLTGVLADWRLPQDRPGEMKAVAAANCVLPWPAFSRAFGETPYTQYLCANSIYLTTLLFTPSGFGLRADRVTAADRINDRRPSWTRGAALMLRN